MATTRSEWWLDHNNLASLLIWLEDNDEIDSGSTYAIVEFLRKPWHWTPEWERMNAVRVSA